MSSILDSLLENLVDKSHEALKDFEEENVDNYEILNIVNEIKIIIKEIGIIMILLWISKKIF